MNFELIRKYEKEFLHMLHGGLLMFKPNDKQVWFDSKESTIDWTVEGLYVIDDMYSTYRKALAEGKTIQFFNTKERLYDSSKPLYTWQDIDKIHTKGRQSDYRIKPEEPKFKVGDWVYDKTDRELIHLYCKGAAEGASISTNEIELWKPQPDEWCWFSSHNLHPKLGQFDEFKGNCYYSRHLSAGGYGFTICEPFIGTLPTKLKDNKWLH